MGVYFEKPGSVYCDYLRLQAWRGKKIIETRLLFLVVDVVFRQIISSRGVFISQKTSAALRCSLPNNPLVLKSWGTIHGLRPWGDAWGLSRAGSMEDTRQKSSPSQFDLCDMLQLRSQIPLVVAGCNGQS